MRFLTSLRPTLRLAPRITTRPFHQTRHFLQDDKADNGEYVDGLAGGKVKGKAAGGQPLESSSDNAPPKPKVWNQSIPGGSQQETLTEEQKKEVEEHNRDFEKKHDIGNRAGEDKVDKKFWSSDKVSDKKGDKEDRATPPEDK